LETERRFEDSPDELLTVALLALDGLEALYREQGLTERAERTSAAARLVEELADLEPAARSEHVAAKSLGACQGG
jgi:hypothetical protein